MAGLSLPSLPAGHVVKASEMQQLMDAITQAFGQSVAKPGDTTLTSNTTLTDDPDLYVTLPANTTWTIKWTLYVSGAAAGDIKCALTFPANATVQQFGGDGLTTASVAASTSADVDTHSVSGQTSSPTSALAFGVPDTNHTTIYLTATVAIGSTAGQVKLQWAQNASSGTGTAVLKGSHVHARQE